MNGLYSVVEFDENDKWFVVSEKEIDNIKYSYLVRVNKSEDDFEDEYKIVRSYFENGSEYMDTLTDKETIQRIMPVLVPESLEYIQNPDLIKKYLKENL